MYQLTHDKFLYQSDINRNLSNFSNAYGFNLSLKSQIKLTLSTKYNKNDTEQILSAVYIQ